MKYVVDASVAFCWAVAEPLTPKAIRLRDDYRNAVHDLLTVDPFGAEIANALVVAERRGRIKPGQGQQFLADILRHAPVIQQSLPDLVPRAFVISISAVASAYDSLYVALAEREGCEFVTADDKLVRNLQAQFPFIVPLSSLP